MRACGNCGAMVNREYDHGSSAGWTCEPARTELDALRAELRDAREAIDGLVTLSGKKEQALRDLRAAVLAIAELARTTEGEDTGEFLAYRLREAVEK